MKKTPRLLDDVHDATRLHHYLIHAERLDQIEHALPRFAVGARVS
jgi:hypothetical protein